MPWARLKRQDKRWFSARSTRFSAGVCWPRGGEDRDLGVPVPVRHRGRGRCTTVNVAYELPRPRWFDGIICYNDPSVKWPVDEHAGLRESWQSVTGFSFVRGEMSSYVDWIAGKNIWFAGPGAGTRA